VPANVNPTFRSRWPGGLAALLAISLLGAAPARALDLPTLRSEQSPLFSADLAVSVDPDGTPGIGLTVNLTYPELQWVKTGDEYAARFEITVVFEPSKGSRLYGDAWDRQARATTFDQTTAYGQTISERRTFHLPTGRYRVRVRLRDLDSGAESVASDHLDVPDYSKVPLTIADLEMGVVDSTGRFVPVPDRTYGFDSDRMAARLAIVDRRDGGWPRSYAVRYHVLGEGGDELQRGTRNVSLARPGDVAIVRPDSAAWFVGTYTFAAELEDGRSHWRSERTFEVEESGPPRGAEYRRMLEPLGYIAETKEVDELSKAPQAQQAEAWYAFWKRRDPTPGTPRNEALIEFLRRVRYAEQHFQHFGPGWRSDMGRIYIKFGPPDQIESRAATLQSPPVEIWYYNRPYRQFVFADREGFGQFVLVSPVSE